MIKLVFSNWHFVRLMRLAIGMFFIVQALISRDSLFGIAGILITSMAIFNIGCCGPAGCKANSRDYKKENNDINYEEVV